MKKLLFEKGNCFYTYPFRIYWKVLDANLEPLFFEPMVQEYQGIDNLSGIRAIQNPSFPLLQIQDNALFPLPAKLLTAVSKKNFKSAVKRNRIKRLIKEAYRLNKQDFLHFMQTTGKYCLIGIIYTAKTPLNYREIEKKILVSLRQLQQLISESAPAQAETSPSTPYTPEADPNKATH